MDNAIPIMPFMIPIVAIVMGIGIGMLSLVLDYRKKRDIYAMHHKERMAAIEKGIEVPPLPPEFFEGGKRANRQRDPLRSGLVLLFVGIAISAALFITHPFSGSWAWGLVPAAVGLARLLAWKFGRDATGSAGEPPANPPQA